MHKDADHKSHEFAGVGRQGSVGADRQAEGRHGGEKAQQSQRAATLHAAVQQHPEQSDRNRVIVQHDAPKQQPA